MTGSSVSAMRLGGTEVPLLRWNTCRVCTSPDRYEIELLIRAGQTYAEVSRDHGVSQASLRNHTKRHIPVVADPPSVRIGSCRVCRSPYRDLIERSRAKGVTPKEILSLLPESTTISIYSILAHHRAGHSNDWTPPPPPPGYVYFLRFCHRVKIGFSINPTKRFGGLPYDEVLLVIPGTRKDESDTHKRFSSLRVTGEWFRLDPEILHYIEQQKESADDLPIER